MGFLIVYIEGDHSTIVPFTKTIFGRSESSSTPDYHTEQKRDQTTAQ